MRVTYGPSNIRCTILPLYAGCMTSSVFQNALAYFDTAIRYEHKIFMKLTPRASFTTFYFLLNLQSG
jgi:hypothetical protein